MVPSVESKTSDGLFSCYQKWEREATKDTIAKVTFFVVCKRVAEVTSLAKNEKVTHGYLSEWEHFEEIDQTAGVWERVEDLFRKAIEGFVEGELKDFSGGQLLVVTAGIETVDKENVLSCKEWPLDTVQVSDVTL